MVSARWQACADKAIVNPLRFNGPTIHLQRPPRRIRNGGRHHTGLWRDQIARHAIGTDGCILKSPPLNRMHLPIVRLIIGHGHQLNGFEVNLSRGIKRHIHCLPALL